MTTFSRTQSRTSTAASANTRRTAPAGGPLQRPLVGQALCISVFGTIAERDRRRDLMRAILTSAGVAIDDQGQPEIRCEVRGRRDVLNEIGGSNPTCPDVLAEWPSQVLTIESKFREHLGPCGQIDLRGKRDGRVEIHPRACSGVHDVGSDLRTGTDAACRLTVPEHEPGERGYRSARRYWGVAADLFLPAVLAPPRSPALSQTASTS